MIATNRLMLAEWTKLKSLRSTWWTLSAMAVASIGLAALVSLGTSSHFSHQPLSYRQDWDPTNESLSGAVFGQLAIAVFGVLAITGEFASGTIRSSIAAVPRRRILLAAKAAVYGGVAFVVGEVISLASFFIGQQLMVGRAPHATIGEPGVARAVLFSGFYFALIALLALGIGCLLRHTAGAISAIVALLLVVPAVIAALPTSIENSLGMYLPLQIGGSSMAAVVRVPHALSPLAGFGLLSLYAAAALGLAGWSLVRRDV